MDILKKAAVNLSRFVATQSLMVATRNDISCQYMKYYIYNDAYVLAYLSMQTFDIMYKMNCKETLQKKIARINHGDLFVLIKRFYSDQFRLNLAINPFPHISLRLDNMVGRETDTSNAEYTSG